MGNQNYSANLDQKFRQKWFVLANRTEAVIYLEGRDHQFHFVTRLNNPKGNLKETDLDSDKPGRSFSSASSLIRHSLDRHSHKHEQTAIRFASRIGRHLGLAAQKKQFEEITLIAEPHFLGLLRENLPPSVLQKKVHSLAREYKQGSALEIRQKVFEASP